VWYARTEQGEAERWTGDIVALGGRGGQFGGGVLESANAGPSERLANVGPGGAHTTCFQTLTAMVSLTCAHVDSPSQEPWLQRFYWGDSGRE